MSSSGMLVEASSKIQKDLVTQRVENIEKADESKKKRLNSKEKTEIDSKLVNTVMSSVAYLLLPGAETMRKIITGNDQNSIIKLGVQGATCALLATNSNQNVLTNNIVRMIADGVICTGLIISNATSSIPILGTLKDALSTVLTLGFTDKLSDTASFVLGIRGVEVIYSSLLRYLPTIIVTIAGILAFLSYFLTLCKYYYISPFVVAFALTTKRVDKIINFLVTGVTIFFKPVLIVLFIYLALFFHTVIDDIFLLFSISQFSIIPYEITDTAAMFVVGACRALLTIFGSLASCYIVWKTIMSGPDWTFKLLGLDKDSDNVIAQGLSKKLEIKAVVVV